MKERDHSRHAAASSSIQRAAAAWVARRDAGLSAEEQEAFERWRQADPQHEAALAHYDSAWNALASPLDHGMADELERELTQLAQRRRQRRWAGSATVAVLLFVGFFLLKPNQHEPAGDTAAIRPTAAILRPRIETLPDGSHVELNAGAEIAVRFTERTRRVALVRGEAHFSVRKDPSRPFVVSADGVEVRAVGTAFNVQLASSSVAILVTEGTVAVEKSPAASPSNATTPNPTTSPAPAAREIAVLSAGEQVEVGRTAALPLSPLQRVSSAESAERLAWRDTRLEFTRTPLREAISLLNQYSNPASPRLIADDPALATIHVTGIFRADNIAGFVHLLEGGFGVETEQSGNTITLRLAR